MRATSEPVLAAGITSFSFHDGGGPVLTDVGLAVPPGSLTAVLGASGSGKTTLGRLLAGWLTPGVGGMLEGYLELAGTRLTFGGSGSSGVQAAPRIDPAQWGRHVGFVPQDASAVLSTVRATVAEELAFGLENAGLPCPEMVEAVERTAGLLGLTGLLDRNPARLSGGQMRRLAIGCAVITRPSVLVMDEPSASLDAGGALELAHLVRHLVGSGTAVVILSQMIDGLLMEADHWLVLAGGTETAAGAPESLRPETGLVPASIRRAAVPAPTTPPAGSAGSAAIATAPQSHGTQDPFLQGRFLQDQPPPDPYRKGVARPPRSRSVAGPALELRDISFSYAPDRDRQGSPRKWFSRRQPPPRQALDAAVLSGLDLAVHPGEIVAVTGQNGAGKSTLLRHLNGLLRPTSGAVLVNGEDIAGQAVGETAASVGLLFQNPRDQLFERTLLREVRFGLDKLDGAGDPGERAAAALAAVGLGREAEGHPAELSASGQRLLALATVLARAPSVIALDEPTVALDGDGLDVLTAAVRQAAGRGAAVVLVTHDLDYARAAAHRTVALDGGRLTPC